MNYSDCGSFRDRLAGGLASGSDARPPAQSQPAGAGHIDARPHHPFGLNEGEPAREGGDSASAPAATLPARASSSAKRLYDAGFSALGLLALSPVLLVIALLIKLTGRGPVFYRQRRVGLHGRPFLICKFRTMVPRADSAGPSVTRDGDARITPVGRLLRKTKLDELPQLWNVLKGEMSLVGPRPEVPRYVRQYTPEQLPILQLKPGITDLASLYFRDEETLLKNAANVEEFYIQHCVPRKLKLNLEYAARANLLTDTWIILQTVCPYWISLLTLYGLTLAAAFWLSCLLVYDFEIPALMKRQFPGTLGAVVAVQIGSLIWRKQCKGLLSYFSIPDLRQVAAALGFSCLLLLGLWAATNGGWPPRNVILVDAVLALCALGGLRLGLRLWRETSSVEEPAGDMPTARVGIVGAGGVGSQLARELMTRRRRNRTVVAFFDDDFQKWHRRIHEIPVVGMPECLLEGWAGKLDGVIIALPPSAAGRIREIKDLLRKAGLKSYTAPSADSLWRQGGDSPPERASS